jgi:23S rRNA (uracil1939-C5)-methyltransferase
MEAKVSTKGLTMSRSSPGDPTRPTLIAMSSDLGEVTDRLELVLDQAVAGGAAIARPIDGPVVLVEGGLPGERVIAQIDARKKSFWRATAIDIIEPSPHRVAPPCPNVARGCGGCDLQHADTDAQAEMKREIVLDALRRIGRLTEPESRVSIGPGLPGTGFRTAVRGGVDESGRFAFRHRHSHDLVTPEHCLVAHPLVDELIDEGRFGTAREVTLRAGVGTGERMAIVTPTTDDVVLPDDVHVVGLDELRAGRRAWFHEIVDGRRFRVSARSFFQSRTDGAAALVGAVRAALVDVGVDGPLPIVDAYCGVGLFGAFLGADGAPIIAIERNRSSVADARQNLSDASATLVSVDVDRWRSSPARAVVADPSREGLGRRAVEQLTATRAPRLVLVSCDPAALGRDTRLLGEAGYELAEATLIDLFPHTHHIEVVSRFDRVPE